MIESILIFLLIVLFLIVPHEFGHFLAAKWRGVRVDEFGVGFPIPGKSWKLFGRKIGETIYTINLLPLGGFVRIFGEEEDIENPRSFSNQPFWARTFIVAAGALANIFIGFVIFTFLAWYGEPRFGVKIAEVTLDSPASMAGLKAGDIVVGIEGQRIPELQLEAVLEYINAKRGVEASFLVERDGHELMLHGTPRENPPKGEGAFGVRIGAEEIGIVRIPWYRAPIEGLRHVIETISLVLLGLWMLVRDLVSSGSVPGQIVGPIGITVVARETLAVSIRLFLSLVALLSINLAVFNILPIPALDGGRIFFFIIEKFRGKPIASTFSHVIHSIFFLLLITLLIVITYREISSFI
ncbi:MAG: M50 family metallopeptidase [Patescibacteria group bacterium]